jgi:cytidyltransferase-like protein
MTSKQRRTNYIGARQRVWQPVEWYRAQDTALVVLPHPIVLVNGAFDLLHVGHMRLLYTAKDHAKTLVVALDSDRKIAANKGPSRPIQSFIERAAALNYMPVDAIVEIDNREDMDALVAALRPDLRVQGWDYKDSTSRYPDIPKLLIRRADTPTSALIQRILAKNKIDPTNQIDTAALGGC